MTCRACLSTSVRIQPQDETTIMSFEYMRLNGSEMAAHCASGILGGALTQRFADGGMVSHGASALLGGHRQQSNAAPRPLGARCVERRDQRHKHFVACGRRDCEMKCAIPLHPAVVSRGFRSSTRAIFNVHEIGLAGLGRGESGDRRFDHYPRTEDIVRARAAQTAIDSECGGRRPTSENGTIAAAAPNLSFELEAPERLPKSPAAHAKLRRELSLGWQAVACLELLFLDVGEHLVHGDNFSRGTCRHGSDIGRTSFSTPQDSLRRG